MGPRRMRARMDGILPLLTCSFSPAVWVIVFPTSLSGRSKKKKKKKKKEPPHEL
jgi:hypothetical protein